MRYNVVLATLAGVLFPIAVIFAPVFDWRNDRPRSPGFPPPAWLLAEPHCYVLQYAPTDWFRSHATWTERLPPTMIELRAEPGIMLREPIGPLIYQVVRRPTHTHDVGWWRYVQADSLDVVLTNQHDSYFGFLLRLSIHDATWHGRAWTPLEDAGHAMVTATPATCMHAIR